MSWDGTGRHPILKMTMEEIRAHNVGTTDRQMGKHADSKDKTAQPDYEYSLKHYLIIAQERSQAFMEHLRQSFFNR